ncbi:MAG: hypothetical protein ACD_79C00041G0005 [uncultured bacterium]|nr:MAG: hypothetical protein ACD_79C00041G0005 [uncultured bacterium]
MSILIALLDSFILAYIFISAIFFAYVSLDLFWHRDAILNFINTAFQSNVYDNYFLLASYVFLFIVLLSIYFRRVRSLSCGDIRVVSKEGNEIIISNKAITDFIHKIVSSISGVQSATVRVFSNSTGAKVYIKIRLNIWEGTCYPEVNEKIQNLVRTKVGADLGLVKITSIPVSLDKMIKKDEKKSDETEEMLLPE